MGQNVLRYLPNTLRVQQCLTVLGRRKFLLVLFRFNRFELRTDIVVVHFELENLFVANRVSDNVRVQFTAKHARCRFST